MSISRINQCPHCKYSLEGLPDIHRCPECGLDYNKNCEVFQASYPFLIFRLILSCMVSFVLLNIWPWISSDYRIFFVVVLGLLWLKVLWGSYHVVLDIRFPKVVVTPNGLIVIKRYGELTQYSWNEIGNAKWNFRTRGITLLSPHGMILESFPRNYFRDSQCLHRFVESVNGWKQRWEQESKDHPTVSNPEISGNPLS